MPDGTTSDMRSRGRERQGLTRLRHRPRRVVCLALLAAAVMMAGTSVVYFMRSDAPSPPVASLSAPLEVRAALGSAGALPPGTSAYPPPKSAVYVSAKGRDGAKGTLSDPMRSVWAGIDRASDGATVVLRSGVYHETVAIPVGKRITLQAYPNEAVWLDGSSVLSSWLQTGSVWEADWPHRFDASPTYTWGAPDDPRPGWAFVNPVHPLAAHPEQVWVNDVPQRQVGTREDVTTGSFYVDNALGRLYIGSDPATGRVEASTLQQAIVVQAAGSVIRGLGVRRYADSVPHQGAITLLAPGITVENATIVESATTGLGLFAAAQTISRVTVSRSGMLGITAFKADGAHLDRVSTVENNTEHFNHSPAAGGLKVTRSRGVTVTGSDLSRNDGTGLWVDESSYDVRLLRNDVQDNAEHGIVVEISAQALLADDRVTNNAKDGILIADSDHVAIWNNTVAGNERNINLTQDERDTLGPSAIGRDLRRPWPDPTVPWLLGSIEVHNNVLAFTNDDGDALLAVEDYTGRRRAEDFSVAVSGNAYIRRDEHTPRWAIVWAIPGPDPRVFAGVQEFQDATGQESFYYSHDTAEVIDAEFVLLPSVQALAGSVARPLPAEVSAAVGKPLGVRHLGDWQN